MSDGILRFSNAEGVTALNRYHNFLTNYGDFGALQRISYTAPANTTDRVTFSSIPQTHQDLMVVVYSRSQQSATQSTLQYYFNNDTTTLYSFTHLQGDGSSATSSRSTGQSVGSVGNTIGNSAASSVFGATHLHILNYTNASTFKTVISRSASDANGSGNTFLTAGLYRSTSAISSVTVGTFGFNFVSGSTVALYGVRASAA